MEESKETHRLVTVRSEEPVQCALPARVTKARQRTGILAKVVFVTILVIGFIIVTVYAGINLKNEENARIETIMDGRIRREVRGWQVFFDQMVLSSAVLAGVAQATFRKPDAYDPVAFSRSASIALRSDTAKSLTGIVWIEHVFDRDRADFEKVARTLYPGISNVNGGPIASFVNGTRVRSEKADLYLPITLFEPVESNEGAIGFNLHSVPARRQTVLRARDSCRAAATDRIQLVQDSDPEAAFVIYFPVFPRAWEDPCQKTLEWRRANILGFIGQVFRAKPLFQTLVLSLSPNVAKDVSLEGIQLVVRDSGIETQTEDFSPSSLLGRGVMFKNLENDLDHDSRKYEMVLPLVVGDRQWAVYAYVDKDYVDSLLDNNWAYVIVFGVCLSVVFVMFVLFWNYYARKNRAYEAAQWQRTQLELTIASLVDSLLLCEMDGTMLYTNPAFDNRTAHRGLVGKSLFDIVQGLEAEELCTLLTREPVRDLRKTILCADGRGTFQGSLCMSITPSNVLVVLIVDETERDEAMTKLRRAECAAREATKHKMNFFAFICHELRNPLHAITAMTEDIIDDVTNVECVKKCAKTIKVSAALMRRIADESLDVSRIEAGYVKLKPVPVVLSDLIRDDIQQFILSSQDRKIVFLAKYGENFDSNQHVYADPTCMLQIVNNLVTNAIKFTQPNGEVTITIEQSCLDLGKKDDSHSLSRRTPGSKNDALVTISVADNGCGMAPEFTSVMFKMYTRDASDTRPARAVPGSGLGLWIVREIVRMMGGEVSCKSEVGQGTVIAVKFVLPFAENLMKTKPPSKISDTQLSSLGRLRFLVADDAPINLKILIRMLKTILKKTGVDITAVADGVELLAKCKDGDTFDLIITDWSMPVMSGYEAVSKMRQCGIDTPVIAVTGNGLSEDREAFLRLQRTLYVTKPFQKDDLRKAIEDALLPKEFNDKSQ